VLLSLGRNDGKKLMPNFMGCLCGVRGKMK